MATISDGAQHYLDEGTARTAGEAMTLTGGSKLTVRTDYRVHANAPASNTGSLSSITVTDGEFIWDSRGVRVLPFSSGTGNVPAIGTTISQGGVSGYFLGVWASWSVAQTTVGSAMPSSGYIKFRSVTGGAFASGALTGIGASATGADRQGWISLPHDAAANFTVPRLGKHTARGGRFFLDNTTGTAEQQIFVPSDGSTSLMPPGIFIENSPGSDDYEFWPALYTSTNGWLQTHIGRLPLSNNKRARFVRAAAGGIIQIGENVSQASTYASVAAQASTYASISHSCTYTWANNVVICYIAGGHFLTTGQQTGLDFTSGGATAYDGTYTVTVLSPYHFSVPLTGSGASGNVTSRPGVAITFTAHGCNHGESTHCTVTSGTLTTNYYEIFGIISANVYWIKYPHTAALTSGNVSVRHTLTITFASHGYSVGSQVKFLGTSGGLNTASVNAVVKTVTSTSIYTINIPPGADASGNATMSCVIGDVPVSGCKTWIPSNILNEVATGARATNTVPNATIATRPEWVTTSAGAIDLEYVYGCSGYASFAQAFSLRMQNCIFFDTVNISEIVTALDIDNVHVGMYGALDVNAFALTSCFAGGTISNSKFERGNTPGTTDHAAYIQYCNNVIFDNCKAGIIQYVRSTGYPWQITGSDGIELNDCTAINGQITLTTSTNTKINNLNYCDRYTGYTNATTPYYAVTISAKCNGTEIDGISFGYGGELLNCHPYTGVVQYTGASDVKIRNIGTLAAPLSGGSWAPNLYSPGWIVATGGNNNNVKVQKCYLDKTRTNLLTNVNSDKNMLFEHVTAGTYVYSAFANRSISFTDLNGSYKALQVIPSTTGQASVYGTHFYDCMLGSEYGRLMLQFNEPTTETAAQFTMNNGTAKFNSSGGLLMTTVGWQASFRDNIFRQGHTGFEIAEVVLTGPTQTRFNIHYRLDKGSGNEDWHNLYYQVAATGGTSGAYTFTLSDASLVEVGDYIWGTGRTNIGKITQIDGNTVTSDVANSATVSGTLRFNHIPSETIDPVDGFKIEVFIMQITAETVAMTHLTINTLTTQTAQLAVDYPLDTFALSLTGLQTGSDVVIRPVSQETVLDSADSITTTFWDYIYETPSNIDISIFKSGYIPAFIRNYALGAADASLPVVQTADPSYLD